MFWTASGWWFKSSCAAKCALNVNDHEIAARPRPHILAMPFPTMPDPDGDRERVQARWHPERETLELTTAGAAKVLDEDHGVTKALARAPLTMAKPDLWRASAERPDFPAGADGRFTRGKVKAPGRRPRHGHRIRLRD